MPYIYIYNKNTVFLEDRKLWCIAKKERDPQIVQIIDLANLKNSIVNTYNK